MTEITRLPGNMEGDFYVNSACVDCDICRQLAPNIFAAREGLSVVAHQPRTRADRRRAFHVLLSCPTGAIGCGSKEGLVEAMNDFPLKLSEDVYYCGYSSAKSYGGHSYLITAPEGNWLIDAPRYVPALVNKMLELGGVSTILLTHIDTDEKTDADKYAQRFGASIILHADEQVERIGNEQPITGTDPIKFNPDITLIPLPGHTIGHTALLFKEKYLFAGDHIHWDRHARELGAVRDYCFHSWPEQTRSMERLLHESFEWVLPRHGDWVRLNRTDMKKGIAGLLQKMVE